MDTPRDLHSSKLGEIGEEDEGSAEIISED